MWLSTGETAPPLGTWYYLDTSLLEFVIDNNIECWSLTLKKSQSFIQFLLSPIGQGQIEFSIRNACEHRLHDYSEVRLDCKRKYAGFFFCLRFYKLSCLLLKLDIYDKKNKPESNQHPLDSQPDALPIELRREICGVGFKL